MNSPTLLMASLHVALGGAIGSVLRYLLGRGITQWLGTAIVSAFPFATLAVNALGSVAMGLLAGYLARQGQAGEPLRLLLGLGLLGGFTTFSAFSLEMVLMIQRGQYQFALLYVILSIGLGVTGLVVGLSVWRLFQ